ncbi:MAG TPA: DNA (cytosine-5-)-methyltransferase [Mycobacteriales bacterium]|nr:DNA (cytosine-5-)-methyltransferase [Mycobacteriales bacterium]
MRVVGLFAGIGGIEQGFVEALGGGLDTQLLCESWQPAQAVLRARFPDVEIHPDVRALSALPGGCDVVAAGFPCTDLSQAGRTAGIEGSQSGLVSHVFDILRLAATRSRNLPWLLIENVPNMLALDRGEAMRYLTGELADLGYRWAYRVVDSRSTGVPQRRRRVLLVASRTEDPRAVLFADDAGARPPSDLHDDAFGFYWTEGRGGLGWAEDAVPTLKGGSTIGIPSPPAIWVPGAPVGRQLITPGVEDAEVMQGLPRGWTACADREGLKNGPRWKLIGNAVTVGVARWVATRLASPGTFCAESREWTGVGAWPRAAWGEGCSVNEVAISEFPLREPYLHLLQVVSADVASTLSHRGASGFWRRLQQGNLGRAPGFREAVIDHIGATGAAVEPVAV